MKCSSISSVTVLAACLAVMGAFPKAAVGQTRKSAESLIVASSDANVTARITAAKALGKIRDPQAVEPLIISLNDADKDVRIAAAEALGKIRDARAVDPLIATLRDKEMFVKGSAELALVAIGVPAVGPLILTLENNDRSVRRWAADALGRIGDIRALEPLLAGLEFAEQETRDLSLLQLGSSWVTQAEIAERSEKLIEVRMFRIATARAFEIIGDARTVAPLIEMIIQHETNLASAAKQALAKIKDPRAIGPLITALAYDHWDVRRSAEAALRNFETAALQPLVDRLGKKDHTEVQRLVGGLLAEMKDSRAADALDRAWNEDDLATVIGGHAYFIRKGTAGTENKLISALDVHGYSGAAESFINSGNQQLSKAGRDWASRHGFVIIRQNRNGLPRWRSSPP